MTVQTITNTASCYRCSVHPVTNPQTITNPKTGRASSLQPRQTHCTRARSPPHAHAPCPASHPQQGKHANQHGPPSSNSPQAHPQYIHTLSAMALMVSGCVVPAAHPASLPLQGALESARWDQTVACARAAASAVYAASAGTLPLRLPRGITAALTRGCPCREVQTGSARHRPLARPTPRGTAPPRGQAARCPLTRS